MRKKKKKKKSNYCGRALVCWEGLETSLSEEGEATTLKDSRTGGAGGSF